MAPESQRLETPLEGLLEAAGLGGRPLAVSFPEPLARHAQELLDTLGVEVRIDPNAPLLSHVRASGRSGKTRRELDPLVRERQRESYYARPDKSAYAPTSVTDE